MATYKGFSTVFDQGNKKYSLTDFDLIKQDLLNALNTRKGSRLMNPDEGTVIWDFIFEPITEESQALLIEDITALIARDPRLAINTIDLTVIENEVTMSLDLIYVKDDVSELLKIRFDEASQTAVFQ